MNTDNNFFPSLTQSDENFFTTKVENTKLRYSWTETLSTKRKVTGFSTEQKLLDPLGGIFPGFVTGEKLESLCKNTRLHY